MPDLKASWFSGLSVSERKVPSPVSPIDAKLARRSFSAGSVGANFNWKSSRSKNRSAVFCSSRRQRGRPVDGRRGRRRFLLEEFREAGPCTRPGSSRPCPSRRRRTAEYGKTTKSKSVALLITSRCLPASRHSSPARPAGRPRRRCHWSGCRGGEVVGIAVDELQRVVAVLVDPRNEQDQRFSTQVGPSISTGCRSSASEQPCRRA